MLSLLMSVSESVVVMLKADLHKVNAAIEKWTGEWLPLVRTSEYSPMSG